MDDCPTTFNTSALLLPEIVPVLIEWTWLLDQLTITYTFTPVMDETVYPSDTLFVVKHGTTILAPVESAWTDEHNFYQVYTKVGAPSLPISTVYAVPDENFATLTGQWVSKFEDLDVQAHV